MYLSTFIIDINLILFCCLSKVLEIKIKYNIEININ